MLFQKEGTARVRNMEFILFYLSRVDHWKDLFRGVIYTFLIEIFSETIRFICNSKKK